MKPNNATYRELVEKMAAIKDPDRSVEQASAWVREAFPYLGSSQRANLLRSLIKAGRAEVLEGLSDHGEYIPEDFKASIDTLAKNLIVGENWEGLRILRSCAELFHTPGTSFDVAEWTAIANRAHRHDHLDAQKIFGDLHPSRTDYEVSASHKQLVDWAIEQKGFEGIRDFFDEHDLTIGRDAIKTALRHSRTDVVEWMFDEWSGRLTGEVVRELSKTVLDCDRDVQEWFIERLSNEQALEAAKALRYSMMSPEELNEESKKYDYLGRLLEILPPDRQTKLYQYCARNSLQNPGCKLIIRYLTYEQGGPDKQQRHQMIEYLFKEGLSFDELYEQAGFSVREYLDAPESRFDNKTRYVMQWLARRPFSAIDRILALDGAPFTDDEFNELLKQLSARSNKLRPMRFVLDRYHEPDDPVGLLADFATHITDDALGEFLGRYTDRNFSRLYEPLLNGQKHMDSDALNSHLNRLIEHGYLPEKPEQFYELYDPDNWDESILQTLSEHNVLPAVEYVNELETQNPEAHETLIETIKPRLTQRQRRSFNLQSESKQANQSASG